MYVRRIYLEELNEEELQERVLFINRVAKVVKGGRRFRFSALLVVGNQNGVVGIGTGKAKEVPEAIQKAAKNAKKNLYKIPIKNSTITHEVMGHFGSADVVMKPASKGTGVIAGNVVRLILDSVGVHNVLTKCLGSVNPHNVARATMQGLKSLRTLEDIAAKRGKRVDQIL